MEDILDQEAKEESLLETHNPNKDIAKILQELSVYYDDEPYKARAFTLASETVLSQKFPIKSGKEAMELKGIGKSTGEIIEEFLKTGKVERLEKLKLENLEKNQVMEKFRNIYGVGPVHALRFYKQGYKTIEDLKNNPDLTEGQKEGIKYYDDLLRKIDRKNIDIFKKDIKPLFLNEKFEIVGSYRRKEKQSGDIDILFNDATGITIDEIKEKLKKYIVAELASGKTKYMAIIKIKENVPASRLDIRLVNTKSWPSALLYFTGSQDFNIYCRNKAIDIGATLNEYGLFKDGKQIELDSEKEILSYLKMKYYKPEERVRNFLSLN